MKASEIASKLCAAWEEGVPKRLQNAQKAFKKASTAHDALKKDDDESKVAKVKSTLAQARAKLTQRQGEKGRIDWLREALRNMIEQAGDVEVELG